MAALVDEDMMGNSEKCEASQSEITDMWHRIWHRTSFFNDMDISMRESKCFGDYSRFSDGRELSR
jgi:hypothetical protein